MCAAQHADFVIEACSIRGVYCFALPLSAAIYIYSHIYRSKLNIGYEIDDMKTINR